MGFAQNTDTLLVVWCTVELRHRTTGGYKYTKGMHCARANCREEYVVGGSKLLRKIWYNKELLCRLHYGMNVQNRPKLIILVKSCSNWCKVVQIGLDFSKLFLVVNIF